MKKRNVLITGASRGIGLACVKHFLEEGWNVVGHFHQSQEWRKELKPFVDQKRLVMLRADFCNSRSINAFLKQLKEWRFDAVVNNAAIYDQSMSKTNRIKEAQKVLLVNTIVPILILEQVFEQMKSKKRGCVVNVSSIAAKYGSQAKHVFYSVSKQGIEAATKTFSRQGAPYNILVNTVRPGVTKTGFHKSIDKDMSKRRKRIPMNRLAEPQEIANTIYFLCGENTYITGEIISVAGGE